VVRMGIERRVLMENRCMELREGMMRKLVQELEDLLPQVTIIAYEFRIDR